MIVAVISVLLSSLLSSSVLLSLAFLSRVLLLSHGVQTLELGSSDTVTNFIRIVSVGSTPSGCADSVGCYTFLSNFPSLHSNPQSISHSISNPTSPLSTLLSNPQTVEVTTMPFILPVSTTPLPHKSTDANASPNVSLDGQIGKNQSGGGHVALNNTSPFRPHLLLVALSSKSSHFPGLMPCSEHDKDFHVPCASSPQEDSQVSVKLGEIRNKIGGTNSHSVIQAVRKHKSEEESINQTFVSRKAKQEERKSIRSSSELILNGGRDDAEIRQTVIKAQPPSGKETKDSTLSWRTQAESMNQTLAYRERKTKRSRGSNARDTQVNYFSLKAAVIFDSAKNQNQKKTRKQNMNPKTERQTENIKSHVKGNKKVIHPTLLAPPSVETQALSEAPGHHGDVSSKRDVERASMRNVKMFLLEEPSRRTSGNVSRRRTRPLSSQDLVDAEEPLEEKNYGAAKREGGKGVHLQGPKEEKVMDGGETKLSESAEGESEIQHTSQSDTSFRALHVSPFIPDLALNDQDSPVDPSLDHPSANAVGTMLVPTASGDNLSAGDGTWIPKPRTFRLQGGNEQADDEETSNTGTGREAGKFSQMGNTGKIETRGMDETLPVRPNQGDEHSENVQGIQNEAAHQFYEKQTNTASDGQEVLVQEDGKLPPLSPSDETGAERGKKVLQRPTRKRGTSQTQDIPLLDTEGSVRIPCYVIIFLLGMIGNTLVIVTLLQNRKMRTITNVFLLNLAFSDLLLGVFCMPFTLIGSLLRDFIFGAVMCRLIPYFQAVSVSVSVWTLVAISLERFYAICQPLKSRGWQTLSHAYKIISLVWLLSLVFMAPIAVLSQLLPVGNTSRHKCREMWPSLHFERGFSMFLCAALLLVPLVIMVAAYSSITVSLWHGMRLERETGQVISLTDLNGLAMVQQSLRRKQSRRHVSKISIRFRKIPAQTKQCVHCGRPEGESSLAYTPSPGEGHPHACLHDPDCENYKWRVESVRESSDGERRRVDGLNDALGLSTSFSPCSRRPTKPDFKRLRSTHLEKSIEAKKHVIRMLFVVVLEFFLCWTPIFVVNIMCLYIPEKVYPTLGSVGISFLHLLSYASSCCNPITYCFMNKKFLQGFRYAFGCRKEAERNGRKNGTAASFRSQSNNIFKLATEVKRDARETTV